MNDLPIGGGVSYFGKSYGNEEPKISGLLLIAKKGFQGESSAHRKNRILANDVPRYNEIDDSTLDLLMQRADDLMEVIHSIQRRRKQNRTAPVSLHI